MAEIIKAVILNGAVGVTVIKSTDIVSKAVKLHGLSNTAAAALGRMLTATAVIGCNLKGKNDSVTVNIRGEGPLGALVTACDSKGNVRGYVENPQVELPLKPNGKLDVSGGVGLPGRMSVVKDLGLKDPFVAQLPLVSGEIAEDFTQYFYQSEQQACAVALGVMMGSNGKCLGAGGIVVQILPFCREEDIKTTEEIVSRLTQVSSDFKTHNAEEVLLQYFGEAQLEILEHKEARFKCKCSKRVADRVLSTLSASEAYELLEERGSIEVGCQFCGKQYVYDKPALDRLKEKGVIREKKAE